MFTPFKLNESIKPNASGDEDDVLKTKAALQKTGDYQTPEWGMTSWPDQQMYDGLKAFQKREELAVDGWMRPGGPSERTLNAVLFETAGGDHDQDLEFKPMMSVGRGGTNRSEDVRSTKRALGALELYPSEKARDPDGDGEDDPDLDFAVSAFERQYNLPRTGRIDPGSPAAARLNRVTRPMTAVRNSFRGTTGPASVRAAATPSSPSSRPVQSVKPTPQPTLSSTTQPKTVAAHHHKVPNPNDFDDPAFGGWSHSDAMRRGTIKNGAQDQLPGPRLREINLEADRIKTIQENRPSLFAIRENPDADASSPWWEISRYGVDAVRRYDEIIERYSKKHRIDADLVRAVMYMENALGHKGFFNDLGDYLGYSDSKMPMNIKESVWSKLLQSNLDGLEDPEPNIEPALCF